MSRLADARHGCVRSVRCGAVRCKPVMCVLYLNERNSGTALRPEVSIRFQYAQSRCSRGAAPAHMWPVSHPAVLSLAAKPVILRGIPAKPDIGSAGLMVVGSSLWKETCTGSLPLCSDARDGEQ